MSVLIDMTGWRFGKLLVIEPVKQGNLTRWKCRCDCGNEKFIRGADLRKGRVKSCGCIRKEKAAEAAASLPHKRKKRTDGVKKEAKKPSICWECRNAVGNCSWSELDPATKKVRFEPVEGWEAEKLPAPVYSTNSVFEDNTTYRVIKCPLFEPDERWEEE